MVSLKATRCGKALSCAYGKLRGDAGQGSVEFALVCIAFLSVALALGALWQALQGGLFVDHALASASHHLQSVTAGTLGDVFLY